LTETEEPALKMENTEQEEPISRSAKILKELPRTADPLWDKLLAMEQSFNTDISPPVKTVPRADREEPILAWDRPETLDPRIKVLATDWGPLTQQNPKIDIPEPASIKEPALTVLPAWSRPETLRADPRLAELSTERDWEISIGPKTEQDAPI
jgi:hypothetical protein